MALDRLTNKLFIRPSYDGRELVSLTLCTTNKQVETDEQILEYFEPDTSGRDIRETAMEFYGREAIWGEILR